MDLIWILLIVLAIVVVLAVAFTLVRKRQRSGSVLAAPPAGKGGRR